MLLGRPYSQALLRLGASCIPMLIANNNFAPIFFPYKVKTWCIVALYVHRAAKMCTKEKRREEKVGMLISSCANHRVHILMYAFMCTHVRHISSKTVLCLNRQSVAQQFVEVAVSQCLRKTDMKKGSSAVQSNPIQCIDAVSGRTLVISIVWNKIF